LVDLPLVDFFWVVLAMCVESRYKE
jgi:hypothetical protein